MTDRSCDWCGRAFAPRSAIHRFDSETCRSKWKDRRRGWQPLGSEVVLTCGQCTATFTRPAATGRGPHLCPALSERPVTRPTADDLAARLRLPFDAWSWVHHPIHRQRSRA
jgi:hypothetical protein